MTAHTAADRGDSQMTENRGRASHTRGAEELTAFPSVRAGHVMAGPQAVEAWVQAAWLMLAEGRAYVEDLEGGTEQPQMQQAAKLRFLEQLLDIDQRLAGRAPVDDGHCLALALEYGMREVADASGPELAAVFGLHEEFGGGACAVDEIYVLWERLLDGFPGELPDRLVAEGQRDMLRTLRVWAELARAAGLDIGFLAPLMKAA
ncbi:DUF6031 family protein [Streptomyces sp. QL37]|uniref:DUF6031 family protein n=1 Tax=Streptomyces sp. QL37 TaxID=2093747 RepID=UPI000CF1CB6E|nr:DUF6031 family protein [Streptomyces sp. QL37]PPQ57557.1 hypothetical protein C5F59_13295 [Streptomyces sp. QL37]